MTEPNPADVLAPCPFCGSSKIQIKTGGAGNWFIECGGCGLTTDDRVYERTIAAWNTRAGQQAQPTPDAMREALEDLLHAVCGETGFAEAVRHDTGTAYPWPALELAEAKARAALEDKHD